MNSNNINDKNGKAMFPVSLEFFPEVFHRSSGGKHGLNTGHISKLYPLHSFLHRCSTHNPVINRLPPSTPQPCTPFPRSAFSFPSIEKTNFFLYNRDSDQNFSTIHPNIPCNTHVYKEACFSL